jgi:large conductance mechanosensitive channel
VDSNGQRAQPHVPRVQEFLLRGNVIDLAVGIAIGVAFAGVVGSLVDDLIMPIIAAIGGEPDFSSLDFTINDAVFRYGNFITVLVSFIILAAAIFFFVVKPPTTSSSAPAPRLPRTDREEVPRVPQRDPHRGAPLRLLHVQVGAAVMA